MSKFLKLMLFSGLMAIVFVLGGALGTCEAGVGKKKTVVIRRKEAAQACIQKYGEMSWVDIINADVSKAYHKKLKGSKDFTKYEILKKINELKKINNLSKLSFADVELETHFSKHGRSVNANSEDEYLRKAIEWIKRLLNDQDNGNLIVKYQFTEDYNGNIGHAAIISKDEGIYFLALGLDTSGKLSIKTFYKFSNKEIVESYKNNTPLLCTIIRRAGKNYAEYDGISIKIYNGEDELTGNVYIVINDFSEDGRPKGVVLKNYDEIEQLIDDEHEFSGEVIDKTRTGYIVQDNQYSKVQTYIDYSYLSSKKYSKGAIINYFITGINYKGYVGSI